MGFDGESFDAGHDEQRLSGQLSRVRELMRDGRWRTLVEIARDAQGSAPGVSARLRDLRKHKWGGWIVERRYVGRGLFEYRLQSPLPTGQAALFDPPSHLPERTR